MKAQFNSRETYLAYRSSWKAEYKNLSSEIRELRKAIKEAQQHGMNGVHASLDAEREACRHKATGLIEERKAAKIEAQRQYLAARTTPVAC